MMHWARMFSLSRSFFYLDSNYTLGSGVCSLFSLSFWAAWVDRRTASQSVEVKSDHLVPGP